MPVKSLTAFTIAIALKSRVERAAVSKVRTPCSQSTTLKLPPFSTCSATSSHSSMVVAGPRDRTTGRGWRAAPLISG